MEQREVIGAILAPLAAPVVFVLQGGFGTTKLSDVFDVEFWLSSGFVALLSFPILLVITLIGLFVYKHLRSRGYANIFTLTIGAAALSYLVSIPIFGIGDGAIMFGICGAAVGFLFWVIAQPTKKYT